MGLWRKKSSKDHVSQFIDDRTAELVRVAGKDVGGDERAATLLVIAAGREIGALYLREGGTVPFASMINDAIQSLWKQAVVGAEGKVPPQFLRAKDDGSELTNCGDEVRYMATARFGEAQALVLLTAAVGRHVADIFSRSGEAVRLEELLKHACDSVREHAYINAPKTPPAEVEELNEQQFNDLAGNILNVAVPNVAVTDSIAATAKALGTLTASMLHFGRANPGASLEDLIASSQQGVAEFAREAMKRFKANESG
jgi:hypothetical protein